jgi:DNA-directed RNA polymerase specialized sigma24 family protein
MQKTQSLNDLYADYAVGLLEKRKFEGLIFRAIQKDIRSLCLPGWDREDYDDYTSWVFPRVSRAIDAYREVGSSFEAYIGTMIRLAAREYRLRQTHKSITESAAWMAHAPDLYACESIPEYDELVTLGKKEASPISALPRNPKQLLILVLKCCSHVSDDFLERVSPRLGIRPETLNGMIARLRERRVKREQEIQLLRERANSQLCRCIVHEKNLRSMVEDSITAQRLKERLERGRNRLAKIRKRLARLRPDPSNLQIAEVLGISKGAVDSALYSLKARWNSDPGKVILN